MKLYDKVKQLLEFYPELRDSDKKLVWQIWKDTDKTFNESISYYDFMRAESPMTISRARRKVVEDHPELASSKGVQRYKDEIERQKGTHVYRAKLL